VSGTPSWLATFILSELLVAIPLALVLLYAIAVRDRS
jgi:hypothetical protein